MQTILRLAVKVESREKRREPGEVEVCSGEKRFESQLLLKVDVFKYLGSNIQSNRKCTREVKKSLQGGWR